MNIVFILDDVTIYIKQCIGVIILERDSIQYCIELALKKKNVLDQNIYKYLTRAALASIYISFILIVCLKLAEVFRLQESLFTSVAYPFVFATALVMIIYGGGELFTSNTMYFTFSTLAKKTSKIDLIRNWITCYSGNILGCFVFAALYYFTGFRRNFL